MELINFPRLVVVWLCLIIFAATSVKGHSLASKPLTYLEFVAQPTIEILPRDRHEIFKSLKTKRNSIQTLQHDDFLRMSFVAFNQTFYLHLEPNIELYHPEATLVIHHQNKTSTTTRLLPNDHRLYKGVVLSINSTDQRLNEDLVGLRRDTLFEELAYSENILGWARIHVLDDGETSENGISTHQPTFEGSFSFQNDLYHVKSIQNFQRVQSTDDPEIPNPSARHHTHRSATMVIYRDKDIKHANPTSRMPKANSCAMEDLSFNTDSNGYRVQRKESLFNDLENSPGFGNSLQYIAPAANRTRLAKRATTSGCPSATKINYMGAAADCTYVRAYGSADAARKQILTDWNAASAVYERTFNITLGLITLEIRDMTCPTTIDQNATWNQNCSDSYTINNRLSDFSAWRGAKGNDGAGLWHLLSTCSTGTKVGVAWVGQLCQTGVTQQTTGNELDYVSGTGVSTMAKDEWKVVAHEIGHGFGAIHDCISSQCPCVVGNCDCCPLSQTTCDANEQFIMNPTDNSATDNFSPCSINDICTSFPNLGSCLEDLGSETRTTLNVSMCGNGIKEGNEQCDCGTNCTNDPCCDGTTCKFKGNAICDDQNDLCCSNCAYKTSGVVCRPAVSSCDLVEVCNGTSATCPPDLHVADGTSCENGLACAGGQCTSRDAQCAARGSRMGITKACTLIPDPDCTISCANPSNAQSCYQISGNFIDGTPCGYGGRCSQGNCNSGGLGSTISSWIDQHKLIVIIVGSVIGAIILCSCIQCFRPKRNAGQRVPSQEEIIPSAAATNWVDPTPYNGTPPPYSGSNNSEQTQSLPAAGMTTRQTTLAASGVGNYPEYSGYTSPRQNGPWSNDQYRNNYSNNYPNNYPSNYPNNYPSNYPNNYPSNYSS